MLDAIYYTGQYLHVLATIVLFVIVWWNQDCCGISLKSQFLYALVFTTRYVDLFTTFVSIENTILKASLVILSYGTILPIILFFLKTYEKQYDKARMLIMIIPCAAIAFWVNPSFDAFQILWAFSLYLEAVAMLPQFQFFANSEGIHRFMIFYIVVMTLYKSLCVVYWNYLYDYSDQSYYHKDRIAKYYQNRKGIELQIAAGVVQILFYCDFFVTIVPRLSIRRHEDRPVAIVADVEADVENRVVESTTTTGHYAENCASAVKLAVTDSFGGVDNNNKKVKFMIPENSDLLGNS